MSIVSAESGSSENLPQDLTELMKVEPVTLQSGELQMRFFPASAWTFKEIKINGRELTQYHSQTSLVVNIHAPGGWVGTGHREAATEQVNKITLRVDGREVDALKGGHFSGNVVELIKESTLANALALKTTFRLEHGQLLTRQELEVFRDIELKLVYAFMFPWLEETTHWMAKTVKGEVVEGEFGARTWELRKDVEWTAIYNPEAQIAARVNFAEGSRSGAGVRHGFWNVKKRYHKQYYQPFKDEKLTSGQNFVWESVVRFVKADAEQWRQRILELQ